MSTTTTRRRLPEGVTPRHSRSCASRHDSACDCAPRYQAHAWDPVTRRKVRKTFRTTAEAKSWRASATAAIERKELRAVKSPTLQAAAGELLEGMRAGAIRARGGDPYKPSTIASYEGSLHQHVLPALGRRRLSDVSRGDLVTLIERLLGAGKSASTIRNCINPLHVLFRRALDQGTIAVSPAAHLPLPALAQGRDRIATPAEQATLLEPLEPADRVLWAVAFGAGLRAGELQGLRWEDVDLDEGALHVRRSWDPKSRTFVAPKSRRSRRAVPLLATVRAALLSHAMATGRRSGLVFGRDGERPFSHSAALSRASKAWAKAQVSPLACDRDAASRGERPLPPCAKLGLHEARHSYCSTMLEAGVSPANVSRYAGHASVAFTLARYVHARADQGADDAGRMDAFLTRAVAP
ncbi:tyrosine-type recombinase/integrase [Miltoncostaea marina]|uniref:tyrosine-type recombinase/integrase n=1 Tax=Miltoncostaea marina TaxID=2843215 RepID=UPI001C3E7FC9|nr:site-specific integrase [Miltoncostaea marina]